MPSSRIRAITLPCGDFAKRGTVRLSQCSYQSQPAQALHRGRRRGRHPAPPAAAVIRDPGPSKHSSVPPFFSYERGRTVGGPRPAQYRPLGDSEGKSEIVKGNQEKVYFFATRLAATAAPAPADPAMSSAPPAYQRNVTSEQRLLHMPPRLASNKASRLWFTPTPAACQPPPLHPK
jgi:hypothetical protein